MITADIITYIVKQLYKGINMEKVIFTLILSCSLIISSAASAEKFDMNKKAFMSVKVKADKGEPNSQFALGGMYYQGIVTKKRSCYGGKYVSKSCGSGTYKSYV